MYLPLYHKITKIFTKAGIACWLKHLTHDRKVASSNPGRSGGRIFFSKVDCVLTLIRCPFHSRVTAVARKRPRSFRQKCRWQVTAKHAYTLDPTKSELADYAAVREQCGNLPGNAHSISPLHPPTSNLSGNVRPQSSQLAGSLWTGAGVESGVSVHELVSA